MICIFPCLNMHEKKAVNMEGEKEEQDKTRQDKNKKNMRQTWHFETGGDILSACPSVYVFSGHLPSPSTYKETGQNRQW